MSLNSKAFQNKTKFLIIMPNFSQRKTQKNLHYINRNSMEISLKAQKRQSCMSFQFLSTVMKH